LKGQDLAPGEGSGQSPARSGKRPQIAFSPHSSARGQQSPRNHQRSLVPMLYRGLDSANARNPYLGSRLTILNHPIGFLSLIASQILPELPYCPPSENRFSAGWCRIQRILHELSGVLRSDVERGMTPSTSAGLLPLSFQVRSRSTLAERGTHEQGRTRWSRSKESR